MANSFTGTFSTPAKEAEFMGYTTNVPNNAFHDETGLTSISMPDVVTTGYSIFIQCPLKSVYLPKCTTLGGNAFRDCNTITFMYIPLAEHVGSGALQGMVNHTWSKCFLSAGFENTNNRNYIFGTKSHGYISFTYDAPLGHGFIIGPNGTAIVNPFAPNGSKKLFKIANGSKAVTLGWNPASNVALRNVFAGATQWKWLSYSEVPKRLQDSVFQIVGGPYVGDWEISQRASGAGVWTGGVVWISDTSQDDSILIQINRIGSPTDIRYIASGTQNFGTWGFPKDGKVYASFYAEAGFDYPHEIDLVIHDK